MIPPPGLSGCEVLPPLRPAQERTAGPPRHAKAKGGHRQAAGRFGVLNAFVDRAMVDLSRVELAVWLVLFRDERNGTAATSQADLSRRTGATDRSVRRALAGLVRRGLVSVVRRGGIKVGPTTYAVRAVRIEK